MKNLASDENKTDIRPCMGFLAASGPVVQHMGPVVHCQGCVEWAERASLSQHWPPQLPWPSPPSSPPLGNEYNYKLAHCTT